VAKDHKKAQTSTSNPTPKDAVLAGDLEDDPMAEQILVTPEEKAALIAARAREWPFGTAQGPIEGFLRSGLRERDPLINDLGNGVCLFPPFTEGGPPRLVTPGRLGDLRCSGEGCENALEGCVHIWEYRFRFGDLAGGSWKPPIKALRRTKGAPPEWERHLERPNPDIDGRKSATIIRQARIAMPDEFPAALFGITDALRRAQEYEDRLAGKRPCRGGPQVDIWDLAVLATLRVHDFLSYEELQARIDRYAKDGNHLGPYLRDWFEYTRVIEAMTGYSKDKRPEKKLAADVRLTIALEKIRAYLLPLFAEITTVGVCDGMVLSTSATDNSRLGRFTRKTKSAQVTLHVIYDLRWGFIIGWRLTWHNHGRGSAESPQFFYLLKTMKEACPRVQVILGDGSYGSAKNRALCLMAGVTLFCELKESQFDGTSALEYLSQAQIDAEKVRCSLDNPLFRQCYPFRNRVEGWNNVTREMARNLISRAEVWRRPKTKVEQTKENPLRSDINLPKDQNEIEEIIRTEQFTGRATHNEMLCRQIASLVRALVKCQKHYGVTVDYAFPVPFKPRPEDDAFSIFRPRIELETA